MRPLVINRENEELVIENYDFDEMICYSDQVLGNGIINDIYDIVFVDPDLFDSQKAGKLPEKLAYLIVNLIEQNKPYLLIGMGRWGTLDPWLGIPVNWEQIAGARAIVETGFKEFSVEPSQGSHFFQNITSFMIGYFNVDHKKDKGNINWIWLLEQNVIPKI